MKHYNLWHSLIFQWSHWFPRVRPWQGRLQNSQNVIPILPPWGFFFLFTALIGHLAGCTCCKMDFPLNQQKQPSEIPHRAPAPANDFQGFCTVFERTRNLICVLPEGRNADWYHVCSKLLKLSHFSSSAVNRCSVLISCIAKLFSVTHLHHDVSVVHTSTHVRLYHSQIPLQRLTETDYKSHSITHLLLHEDYHVAHCEQRGMRCYSLFRLKFGLTLPNFIPISSHSFRQFD